ncbi:MAG: hypothetical protein E7812_04460 [Phenylobacterium sp.]|nr:MAG: hypothetical protein E7812_04460 [Phenylobacterium sp.]
MQDGADIIAIEEVYTLLGVRRDGVASVVDLVADSSAHAHHRAATLLREHASCEAVEIWRDGVLVETVGREA